MKTWIKLYTEIVEDPDQGTLTLAERGIWSLCLALCGRIDDRDPEGNETGKLDTPERIAWYLRCVVAEIKDALVAFAERGMVEEREGIFYLPNFATRQQRKPSDSPERIRERVTRYRQNETLCNAHETPCNADVTPVKRPVTRTDPDTDPDADAVVPSQEKRPTATSDTATLFAMLNDAGVIVGSQMQSEEWLDVLEVTSDMGLIREALTDAASLGKRPNAKYLRRTLERCLAEHCRPGERTARASPRARAAPATSPSVPVYNAATEQYERMNPETQHWEAVEKDDQGGWRVIPWLSGGDDDGKSQ